MSELALKCIQRNKIKHARGKDARSLDLGNCDFQGTIPRQVMRELTKLHWLEELSFSAEYYNYDTNTQVSSQNKGGKNQLNALPAEIGALKNLKKLIARGQDNKWRLEDFSPLAALFQLQVLHVDNTEISTLTPLQHLKKLQHLSIHNTLLDDFAFLQFFPQLQLLDASETRVRDLSPLRASEHLHTFSISSSQVTDIAPLQHLTKLRRLFISRTRIKDLSALRHLRQLQLFFASNTLIEDLSDLQNLSELRLFKAYNTSVADLRPLSSALQLQLLDISGTRVQDLSPLLPLIEKGIAVKWGFRGNGILVADCPLTSPPPEVVKEGNEAILRYFTEREKQGAEKIYEAKLVLIGDGRAGKTTLRDKLNDRNAPLPPEDATTKGVQIDIAKYQFNGDHGQPFSVNVWDFAGQEKYQGIHQFFYTHRALYIFVENSREQKTDFDYWLQTADLCSGGSPVLIVHNEFGDQNRGLFNLGEYQGRYGNLLKGALRVNFATGRGLDELERAIRYHIQQLPHVGEELPRIWAEIRAVLRDLSATKPYLSLEAYLDLCRDKGIPEEDRALNLSRYLHILGAMLHYVDNPLLSQYVILQNEWATDAVYRILDDESITFESKGRFSMADLDRIWTRSDFVRMKPQLLELMKKFKLCYQVRDLDRFIAPQLLPATPPEGYHWTPDNDLRLVLQYEFMPKGLLTRFTVNRHTDIAEGQTLAWNTGVVLEWRGTRAEVTEQYRVNKGTIEIRVQGADRKGLLSIVDKNFDELHGDFQGIKVEKMIPCNCAGCVASAGKAHFYRYSQLLKMRESRITDVQCGEQFVMVDVRKLIEDVFETGSCAQKPFLLKLLEDGRIREILEKMRTDYPDVTEMLAQFNSAERAFNKGLIEFAEFQNVQSRLSEAAQNLLR